MPRGLRRTCLAIGLLLTLGCCSSHSVHPSAAAAPVIVNHGNPLFRTLYTADPAPLVVGDTLYLYVGHDEARGDQLFNITEWLAFSTTDMQHWTAHGPIMKPTDFAWAQKDAWASQVHEKDGKFWFYTAVEHDPATSRGKAIGVAVADNPLGPFKDARGTALVRNEDTKGPHNWDDIDPTVWTDEHHVSWLIWGNAVCKIARLKPNMIELDGPIRTIDLPDFEEGPWVFKRGGLYYLVYASMDKAINPNERISYATAANIEGPWTWRGAITGPAANSFTIHPGVIEFKGQWYFFYHVGTLRVGDQAGGLGRRAVELEKMVFNGDWTMRPIRQT
ncbi:MAG: glycoside hydrolase family 43 protein, partial [Sphingomicrobium sp.]